MNQEDVPSDFKDQAESLAERTGLSPTRSKVLVLIKLHKEKDEIADLLDITPRTVQNHIQDLRNEIETANELIDIAGRTHYEDSSLFKEFGGSLWMFRSGLEYEKNDDTTIEKKLYGSYHGACLLIEREITERQGSITEERKRTEFYDGNDIPPYLFRRGQFQSYEVAALHTAFVANAGIDPKYSPSELLSNEQKESEQETSFEDVQDLVNSTDDGWITR